MRVCRWDVRGIVNVQEERGELCELLLGVSFSISSVYRHYFNVSLIFSPPPSSSNTPTPSANKNRQNKHTQKVSSTAPIGDSTSTYRRKSKKLYDAVNGRKRRHNREKYQLVFPPHTKSFSVSLVSGK